MHNVFARRVEGGCIRLGVDDTKLIGQYVYAGMLGKGEYAYRGN